VLGWGESTHFEVGPSSVKRQNERKTKRRRYKDIYYRVWKKTDYKYANAATNARKQGGDLTVISNKSTDERGYVQNNPGRTSKKLAGRELLIMSGLGEEKD